MGLGKTLLALIAAGTLTLGVSGCTNYKGEIGTEPVTLKKGIYNSFLSVTKPDGRIITYRDYTHDSIVNAIKIKREGRTIRYPAEEVPEAQEKFEYYSEQIRLQMTAD